MLSSYSLVHDGCGYTATPGDAVALRGLHQPAGRGHRQLPRRLLPGARQPDHLAVPQSRSAGDPRGRTALRDLGARGRPARPRLSRRRRRRRRAAGRQSAAAAWLRGQPGPGLLLELDPFRLDEQGAALRPADLQAARRRALHHQQRRERSCQRVDRPKLKERTLEEVPLAQQALNAITAGKAFSAGSADSSAGSSLRSTKTAARPKRRGIRSWMRRNERAGGGDSRSTPRRLLRRSAPSDRRGAGRLTRWSRALWATE